MYNIISIPVTHVTLLGTLLLYQRTVLSLLACVEISGLIYVQSSLQTGDLSVSHIVGLVKFIWPRVAAYDCI